MQAHLQIPYLCEYIRDIAFGTPRQQHDQLVRELKQNFHPTCDPVKCRWSKWSVFHGSIMRRPNLYRETRRVCSRCALDMVSDYEHSVCHQCAQIYDEIEFEYHHVLCESESEYDYHHYSFTRQCEE